MECKIRLGVIGVGNMGSGHITNICDGKCPEFEVAAVAELKPERLTWAREKLGEDLVCFKDAMAMLDSGLVEACIVSVPHYDHPRYAIACMQLGIHVMVEKPAGVYVKQVLEMNEEAARHPDVVFGMMFNQRTNCVYRKMRELVQSEPEFSKNNKVPFAFPKATQLDVQLDGENPQHYAVLNAWAGAILRGEPLVAHGSEGVNGLTLSNAMHLSGFLGKPVTLPLDCEEYDSMLLSRQTAYEQKHSVGHSRTEYDARWQVNW